MASFNSKRKCEKFNRRRPRLVDDTGFGQFTLLFVEDGKEMYKDL